MVKLLKWKVSEPSDRTPVCVQGVPQAGSSTTTVDEPAIVSRRFREQVGTNGHGEASGNAGRSSKTGRRFLSVLCRSKGGGSSSRAGGWRKIATCAAFLPGGIGMLLSGCGGRQPQVQKDPAPVEVEAPPTWIQGDPPPEMPPATESSMPEEVEQALASCLAAAPDGRPSAVLSQARALVASDGPLGTWLEDVRQRVVDPKTESDRGLLAALEGAELSDETRFFAALSCGTFEDWLGERGELQLAVADSLVADVIRRDADQPLFGGDLPDPYVFSEDGRHLWYGTNTAGMNVPVLDAVGLVRGEAVDALPNEGLGAWARPGVSRVWAPAVTRLPNGSYALFYSGEERATGQMGIGVAVADSPMGPFADARGAPIVGTGSGPAGAGGAIDPAIFTEDGKSYLVWKNDGNAVGAETKIWLQELTPDGQGLLGEPRPLLGEAGHQAWEVASYTAPRPLIEGATLFEEGGTYFLVYSANDWHSPAYGINYATSSSLDEPFVRAEGPWVGADEGRAGPGGQEFFRDENGDLYMLFHAWSPEAPGYGDLDGDGVDDGGARRLYVRRVEASQGGLRLARDG